MSRIESTSIIAIEIQLQRWLRLVIFSLTALITQIAGPSMPIFADGQSSRSSTRFIKAKWVDNQAISVDGDLSESVWQTTEADEIAAHFFRAEQTRGVLAKLDTEAMVLYDETTLYIGFRCQESNMNNLRQTKTRRDAFVWHDDAVEVMLDTYNDQRNCYVFAVNTLGTLMDERISNESAFDISWDAKWQAKVKKNSDHWTAEFAIPFRELRFDRDHTTWGISFWRAHPMDGESYSWSDTGGLFGKVSEFGKLTGLDLSKVSTKRKLGLLPYVTHRALENQKDDADSGLDLILPLSTNITTNVTFNPDFSQLESDPTQISISSDRELSLPERRPFFREGADLFELPLNLFYTRRVQEIDFGLKTAGKAGAYNFALINTYGQMVDRYDNDDKKQANLFAMRVNRDLGQRTVIGIMGIQKHQTDRDLELLSLNSRFALHRDWTVQSQYVVDFLDDETHWAYHLSTNWRHERGWGGEVRFEEIQNGFRPNEMGLEDEAFRKLSGNFRYIHRFAEGKLIKSYHTGVFYLYQTDGQHLLRERINQLFGGFDIGKFELFSFAGVGAQREVGSLFDTKFLGTELDYRSTWGRLGVFNRFGTRQDKFSRYTNVTADVNLFGKLTTDLHLSHFFWRDHRSTFIFRLRSNYQFTKKIGWRIFLERVNERFEDEVSYNFNSIFDYEFTPESHFYFVLVDSVDGDRAVFTKMAYLFEN